jgi:hypothetical protein
MRKHGRVRVYVSHQVSQKTREKKNGLSFSLRVKQTASINMLLTNPIEEDVFERTNENEEEERACEKERSRRRLNNGDSDEDDDSGDSEENGTDETSSSSSSSSSFAFLFNEKERQLRPILVETMAFFSNSRIPLTICEEILSLQKFEKIGQVKTSGVGERNDFLSDDFDGQRNRTCDIFYQEETKIALVRCKYDVPVENATRWAETLVKCLFPDLSERLISLRKVFVVTSFVSSYADDTDVDENSFGSSTRFAVQYVGNEAYKAIASSNATPDSCKKKPLSVGRAVVGTEAALFNRLNQMTSAELSSRTKIALLTCPDERSFSGTADDIIDARALKNVLDVLRENFLDREDDDEWCKILRSVDETALNEWARRGGGRHRHHLQLNDATSFATSFNVADDNLFC